MSCKGSPRLGGVSEGRALDTGAFHGEKEMLNKGEQQSLAHAVCALVRSIRDDGFDEI